MKFINHLAILLPAMILTSCIKDEPQNMECDILEAWVEGDSLTRYFIKDTDMRISDVASSTEYLTFTIRQKATLPAMPIYFKLTPGATIAPANGSRQDFSNGPVTYIVTSEDGQWHRTYEVDCREAVLPSSQYDFEDFELSSSGKYYVWYDKGKGGTIDRIWASGNEGFMIANPTATPTDYPTAPDSSGIDGYCVRLTTRSTGSLGRLFKKPIGAGNFYLGSFDSRHALTNTLLCTRMGIPYSKEPVKVTGYYKYTPGEVFTDKNFKEVKGRIDEPTIYSVLYLNHDEEGNEIMLNGENVQTSPYIVRKAQVASLPPTTEWQPFEMTFDGSVPIDATLLANQGYNLALVFSSSKTGDKFEGAIGSTLYIDKVAITFITEQTTDEAQ